MIRTVDYHTAGEPFRIVTAGAPDIPGATVLDRREAAIHGPADQVRALLCSEPRGHADMYGAFLVPPDDEAGDLGVLFWHKDGFSTACGHGTIALAAYAVDAALVDAPDDGVRPVVIDVPSGRVTAHVARTGGRTTSVTFENVASHVIATNHPVSTSRGSIDVDLAYGGAVYASARAADVGLAVEPGHLDGLISVAREIKAALLEHPKLTHAYDDRLSGVYGVIWYDELGEDDGMLRQRNCTVFADGEVDRSPCGSGTSARLALLHAQGRMPVGRVLEHNSVIGTTFLGRVHSSDSPTSGVMTTVEGNAYRTGVHEFVIDDDDPLVPGFQLR